MIRINKEMLNYFSKLHLSKNHDYLEKAFFLPGDFLIHQNKKRNTIFIIISGVTKCYAREENGRDFIQEFFGKGEIVGEIEVFTDTLSFSNVQALTNVATYKLNKTDLYNLMRIQNDLNLMIVKALAVKIRDTAIRASQQQVHPLDYNLNQLKKLMSDQKIDFCKQDLADYLGITLRSLNRSLKNY